MLALLKIKWLGHSAFLITSDKGIRIITDPYKTGGELSYGEIKETADVVTVSHEHYDHNNVDSINGNPQVYRGPDAAEIKGVKFSSIAAFHDDRQGKQRSVNTIICMDIDGMHICHLGDLGHLLSPQQIAQVGKIDVLLIPVGGYYTIDAAVATRISDALKPKFVIPMHFKNDRCAYPITPVTDFLRDKKNVKLVDKSEVEFKAESLPVTTQIVVLTPSL
jgi:L-ascorbate metabolism protein UlaG (beta-lactamase superfamily)